jgi:RNA polymerase primary sigma factor
MAKPELLGSEEADLDGEERLSTYDELNSTLPAEVVSSEQFGSIDDVRRNGHRDCRCA